MSKLPIFYTAGAPVVYVVGILVTHPTFWRKGCRFDKALVGKILAISQSKVPAKKRGLPC